MTLKPKTSLYAILLLIGASLSGCADAIKREQLEKVAKDWCLTIRASQVIPIYPLSENLLPGDVFLVTQPIQDQHREYSERGFLTLDQQLTRLQGLDYQSYYSGSHGTKDRSNTPYHWQFPPDGIPRPPSPSPGNTATPPNKHTAKTEWGYAPRAAFPTYTFEVDLAGGIKAALPIKGVPVALSMMQTDKAFGSVTLSDAYTYGLPYDALGDVLTLLEK